MSSTAVAPRARKTFSRLKHVLDLPNLIDIQKASFQWFLDEGLRETINDISPITDYTGTLAVEFGDYEFGPPQHSISECREKDLTYQAPLSMTVRFVNTETGEIREQRVFMGDFPMMTEHGTFIINGTERVIVTQLVRSPGAYLMEPKDATKQVFTANLMPSRGSWLELEIDKKGIVYARIDRKRKLPITTLLRALPAEDPTTGFELDTSTNEAILSLFDESTRVVHPEHARQGPLDPRGGGPHRGLQEAAPGRAADARQRAKPAALAVLRPEALRPDEGRPVQAQPAARRLGAGGRPGAHHRGHPRARAQARRPAGVARRARGREGLRRRGGRHVARAHPRRARRVRALRQPPAPHDGRADPGGVPRRSLPHGARGAGADDDRGRRHDHAADDHQHPSGRGGAQGVLRLLAAVAVPRPDELAVEPHAPSPPVGARRRRPDPRARADRGARRPPDPLRPDVPDRDAGRPEHRPDRRARLVRHGLRVRLHPDAVPGGREGEGLRRDHLPRRRPGGAVHDRAGIRGDRPEDQQVRQRAGAVPLRGRRSRDRAGRPGRLHGRLAGADRLGRDGADPVPRAQRRQPGADGREHAAAGSAADDPAGAARRHRPRVPGRRRHRRRRPRAERGHGDRRRR